MKMTPKVYVPTLVNIAVGVILLLADERDMGVAVLLAAVINGGLGYAAPRAKGPK